MTDLMPATVADTPAQERKQDEIRPVGAWVVGGFVLATTIVLWLLVFGLFLHRA